MNTNLNSPIPSTRSISGEGWAAIVGAVGSVFLLLKKLFSLKAASKPEVVSRAHFDAQMLEVRERINANHVAMLEKLEAKELATLGKLDANQRELLAALQGQSGRINAVETGLARVDERTRRRA